MSLTVENGTTVATGANQIIKARCGTGSGNAYLNGFSVELI